ncbi:MAG: hypothetical protein JW727_03655 [Candidatus Aenigmarchaeota archaeon]|nr:hypothetical protein [Candidatus Aenigmarchaeota archaeon]
MELLLRVNYKPTILKILIVCVFLLLLLVFATSFTGNFVLADPKLSVYADFPDIFFIGIGDGILNGQIYDKKHSTEILEPRLLDKMTIIS